MTKKEPVIASIFCKETDDGYQMPGDMVTGELDLHTIVYHEKVSSKIHCDVYVGTDIKRIRTFLITSGMSISEDLPCELVMVATEDLPTYRENVEDIKTFAHFMVDEELTIGTLPVSLEGNEKYPKLTTHKLKCGVTLIWVRREGQEDMEWEYM